MKTLKNILLIFAVAVFVIPAFNGCKKGAEDPFLSFRSRDKRIEGTWTLKSVDYTYTNDTKSTTTNTVNSANSSSTGNTNYTVAYDGSNMTITKLSAPSMSNYTDNDKTYDGLTSSFKSVTNTSVESKTETWVTSYTITISIYKDNTYSYTTTKKATSYSRSTSKTFNGTAVTPSPKDTSIAGTYDGANYFTTDEDTKTEVGVWSWADDEKSGKNKIIINAGPLTGFLVRLSNKELIIDHSYGTNSNFFIEDFTYQFEMTEDDNMNQVQTDKVTYSTHNNALPAQTADGTETTTTTTVKKVVSGKSTWEKTDKKRKREEEASAE